MCVFSPIGAIVAQGTSGDHRTLVGPLALMVPLVESLPEQQFLLFNLVPMVESKLPLMPMVPLVEPFAPILLFVGLMEP